MLKGKLAFSIKGFVAATDLPRSTVIDKLNTGELKGRKSGRRVVILAEDGLDFLQNLPARELRADDEDGLACPGPEMKPPARLAACAEATESANALGCPVHKGELEPEMKPPAA